MTNVDVFQVLATEDAEEQERVAGTRAVIAVQSRALDRFSKFVAKANNTDELEARLALIESNLREIAASSAEDYGYEYPDTLYQAATIALGGGHASDCGCGFCENMGNLPGSKKDTGPLPDVDDDHPDNDTGDEGEKFEASVKCACGCNGKCAGECKCGDENCSCGSKESSFTSAELTPATPQESHDLGMCYVDGSMVIRNKNGEAIGLYHPEVGSRGPNNKPWGGNAPWEGNTTPVTAGFRLVSDTAFEDGDHYQSETVDLPSADASGLGGPSPKIDKSKSGDETGWSTSPIEVDSVRNKLDSQSVSDKAKFDAADFDPSSPLRTTVDADKAMQPEFNVAPDTQTFGDQKNQANPVTSGTLDNWLVVT